MTPQQIIHAGAGYPDVHGSDGAPLARGDRGACAYCGRPAVYKLKDCLSSNFTVAKQLKLGAAGLCEACAFCLRDLRLRCAPWFAREDGIWFTDRAGLLACLLDPPKPPFVVGWPIMGPKKGGLSNAQFAPVWRETEPQLTHPVKGRPLTKLQSKHVAIFAQTAHQRDVYPVTIDDNTVFELDRSLWARLAAATHEALRFIPVPCLEQWTPPDSTQPQWREGIIRWRTLTAPMEPYRHAIWWPLLLGIVPRPDRQSDAKAQPLAKPSPARPLPKQPQAGQLILF